MHSVGCAGAGRVTLIGSAARLSLRGLAVERSSRCAKWWPVSGTAGAAAGLRCGARTL